MDDGNHQQESPVDAAARRQEWLNSDENQKLRRFIWWLAAVLPISIAIGLLGVKLVATDPEKFNYEVAVAYACILWLVFAGYAYYLRKLQLRSQFNDRIILSKSRSDLQRAEDEVVSGETTDFLSLWNVTQKRLAYYHDIATAHAEKSFSYGQIAAASGFIVLLVGATIAAFTTTISGAIAAAIAGIAGGGLGAYIGATFMRSQDVAAEQMREYFRQPLEFSKFLGAERLLDTLDGDARTQATQAIIEAMIKNDYLSKGS